MGRIAITGVRETISALNRIKRNFQAFKKVATKNFSEQVVEVAKKNVKKDTGALHDSIHSKMDKDTPEVLIFKVIAGSPDVRRGEGKYKIGHGSSGGRKVSVLATNKYAEAHENDRRYMETASDFTLSRFVKAIEKAIGDSLRSF